MISHLEDTLQEINRRRTDKALHEVHALEAAVEKEYLCSTKLFVYGTLGPGQPNERVLSCIHGEWIAASVRGHLHPLGWGATLGYPAIELDRQGPKVAGHIYISPDLPNNWAKLDRFEGSEYVRLLTLVEYSDGANDVANIYASASPLSE